MELQRAKELAKTYYTTFYLDLSGKKLGMTGGFALISAMLFFLFLTFSIILHSHGISTASYFTFSATIIFEITTLLLFHFTEKNQREETLKRDINLIPSLATFSESDVPIYKKRWIEKNFNTPQTEFLELCNAIETAISKQKEYSNKASGIGNFRFFSTSKDRVLSLGLAYISIMIAILGSNNFNLDSFFSFYGDLTNYFTFSAILFVSFSSVVVLIASFTAPARLIVNCIWQTTLKNTTCTKITLYTFLRDCHKLSSIK